VTMAWCSAADPQDMPEAVQSVGHYLGVRRQRTGGKAGDSLGRVRQLRQAKVLGRAVRRGRHGNDERHLVRTGASPAAAGAFATEESVVDLHQPVELAGLLAQQHHLHELVLDQPSGLVADAQVAHEFERRDAVLGLHHQVHREEPALQRQLGGFEDGATEHAALVPATRALPIQQAGTPERAAIGRFATRTDKSLRPALRGQHRLALLLAAVSLQELTHRQALLKLHSVHRHGSLGISWLLNGYQPAETPPGEPWYSNFGGKVQESS